MNTKTPELKRVATELIGAKASQSLMNRILVTLDESPNPHDAMVKVERLVALFLGASQASALKQSFQKVIG